MTDIRRTDDALTAMIRLSEVLVSSSPLHDVLEASMDALRDVTHADRAAVLLLDADRVMRFEAARGLSAEYMASVEGHSPWRLDDPDPRTVLVSDGESEAALSHLRDSIRSERIRSIAFIPLVASGTLIGKFMAYHASPGAFTEEDGVVAEVIARHVAAAIDRIRQHRGLAVQYAVARALTASSDEEMLRNALHGVADVLGWRFGAAWRATKDQRSVSCIATWPDGPAVPAFAAATLNSTFARGEGLPGRVLATGLSEWVTDVAADEGFVRKDAARSDGLVAAFAFPVITEDRVVAVLEFLTDEPRPLDGELVRQSERAAGQIAERLKRREAERLSTAADALRSALFDAALDAVLTMDDEGRLLDLNANAETMFGVSRTDVGSRIADLVVPPELRAAHEEGLQRYLASGESRILDRRLELTAMRADGARFPVELTVTRVEAPGSRAFTAFVRDISDRRRHEEALTFLAQVGPELNRSLDPERTLETMSRLVVPQFADWSATYVAEADGRIRRLSLRHADPTHAPISRQIEASPELDATASVGVPKVIRTGQPEFYPTASPSLLAADSTDPTAQSALIAPIGVRSWICVPVRAHGRVVGAASFVATGRRSFGDEDLAVFIQLADRASIALENALLYQERDDTVRVLQERLLPPELPVMPGVDAAAVYVPAGAAELIGGDFYDVFESGSHTWSVLIGDVCGKGIGAAAVTSVVRNAVRAAAIHDPAPGDALMTANEILLNDPVDFVTACLVRLRNARRGFRADISAAGHPLPFVVRAEGVVERVGRPGTALGVVDDPELGDERVLLHGGDVLFLYTDGLSEHRRPGGEPFGEERIGHALASCAGASPDDTLASITDAIDAFFHSPPRDDIAMLALRVAHA